MLSLTNSAFSPDKIIALPSVKSPSHLTLYDSYAHGKFKVGTYSDGYLHNNVLTVVDNNVKNDLLKYYGDSEKLSQILGGIEETTTTGSVGGSYVTPKIWAKSPSDMKFGKTPMIKGGKILKEPLSEVDKVKMERFVAEMDMYIFAEDKEHAIVEANNIAKLVNKKFDASARVTKMIPRGFGQIGENIAERTGQVEFDDCTKLNNNTEAQDGGCSVGAVDDVVKVDENIIKEVAKKTGRSISEVKNIILKHKKINNGK